MRGQFILVFLFPKAKTHFYAPWLGERIAVTTHGCSYVWNRMDIHTTTHLCDGDKRILLV